MPAVYCLIENKHQENSEYITDKQNKTVPGQPGNGEAQKLLQYGAEGLGSTVFYAAVLRLEDSVFQLILMTEQICTIFASKACHTKTAGFCSILQIFRGKKA